MGKKEDEISTVYNIIGSGTEFTGNFKSNGNLRIDGIFSGELNIGGKLVVGTAGSIEGKAICRSAEIEGRIKVSTIEVEETLGLKSTASLIGDVKTGKIYIEQGAVFIGHCSMPFLIEE